MRGARTGKSDVANAVDFVSFEDDQIHRNRSVGHGFSPA